VKKAGGNPAIFKYSLGSTSLANDWRGPGESGMYDKMATEFKGAVSLLKKKGHTVTIQGFIWIQGESDAETPAMAGAYKDRLKTLIDDVRNVVAKQPELPVILGVDEQHDWVKTNPQVLEAQQALANKDSPMRTGLFERRQPKP
jgi:hypothetical protein